MIHKGPIYKVTLFIPFGEITMERLNMWFQFLSERNIKYLNVVNFSTTLNQMLYIVFFCKELTDFEFCGFILSIPPNFCGIKRLLNLRLCVAFESGALTNLNYIA
jgi:hypothetical protein